MIISSGGRTRAVLGYNPGYRIIYRSFRMATELHLHEMGIMKDEEFEMNVYKDSKK